jgi:hypothetical protein
VTFELERVQLPSYLLRALTHAQCPQFIIVIYALSLCFCFALLPRSPPLCAILRYFEQNSVTYYSDIYIASSELTACCHDWHATSVRCVMPAHIPVRSSPTCQHETFPPARHSFCLELNLSFLFCFLTLFASFRCDVHVRYIAVMLHRILRQVAWNRTGLTQYTYNEQCVWTMAEAPLSHS